MRLLTPLSQQLQQPKQGSPAPQALYSCRIWFSNLLSLPGAVPVSPPKPEVSIHLCSIPNTTCFLARFPFKPTIFTSL